MSAKNFHPYLVLQSSVLAFAAAVGPLPIPQVNLVCRYALREANLDWGLRILPHSQEQTLVKASKYGDGKGTPNIANSFILRDERGVELIPKVKGQLADSLHFRRDRAVKPNGLVNLAQILDSSVGRSFRNRLISQRNRTIQTIEFNSRPIRGQLNNNSERMADNSFFNRYYFEGQARQQIVIEMVSWEIDPYLILIGPNQQELKQDDDSAGNGNARIEAILPVSGTYSILATSYSSGEQGRYELSLQAPWSISSRYLLQETGQLEQGDNRLTDNSLFDEYWFQGQSNQRVTITLSSSDFDTYLLLLDSEGNKLAENDDRLGNSTDSEIVLTLPRTGGYRVIVNSYDAVGQGAYSLTIQ